MVLEAEDRDCATAATPKGAIISVLPPGSVSVSGW